MHTPLGLTYHAGTFMKTYLRSRVIEELVESGMMSMDEADEYWEYNFVRDHTIICVDDSLEQDEIKEILEEQNETQENRPVDGCCCSD